MDVVLFQQPGFLVYYTFWIRINLMLRYTDIVFFPSWTNVWINRFSIYSGDHVRNIKTTQQHNNNNNNNNPQKELEIKRNNQIKWRTFFAHTFSRIIWANSPKKTKNNAQQTKNKANKFRQQNKIMGIVEERNELKLIRFNRLSWSPFSLFVFFSKSETINTRKYFFVIFQIQLSFLFVVFFCFVFFQF